MSSQKPSQTPPPGGSGGTAPTPAPPAAAPVTTPPPTPPEPVVPDESPDAVSVWVASIDDDPVRRLDFRLLQDLIELQTDQTQWRELLASLAGSIGDAIASGDWPAAADNAEAAIRFIVTTMDDAQLLPL